MKEQTAEEKLNNFLEDILLAFPQLNMELLKEFIKNAKEEYSCQYIGNKKMLTRQQYYLIKLAEECNEVAQRAIKGLIFGMDESQPNQELNNTQRLIMEVNDLLGILELMKDEKMIKEYKDEELITIKKLKVEHYMAYSRKLGIVE